MIKYRPSILNYYLSMNLIILMVYQNNSKKLNFDKNNLKENLLKSNKMSLWKILNNMQIFYKINFKVCTTWLVLQTKKYIKS